MRFRLAALAASLAVTALGSTPASSAPMQDRSDDGIRTFLVRLERVVLQSDVAAYGALLTDSADRVRAAQFVDAELVPGMTRAVIQERERRALPGTLAGDGYTVMVDVFEEYGGRARVSTWWLDVKRTGGETEWLIEDQGRLSSVEDLYRLSLNPGRQFIAHNLEFRDEDLELTLIDGSVFVSDTDQGTTALVFNGRGSMTFQPAPETEKSQVRIFSGADAIITRFDAAYIRINPRDFDRLIAGGRLEEASVDQDDFKRADRIFREDFPKSYSLELADLSRETWSLMPRPRDVVAEIHTRRFDTLTYARASMLREDISLFDRDRHKTIAQYSSALNARREGAADGAEDGAEIEARHYDIDISATPERHWIEGRARMTIRVGGNTAISNLTLRLAEPLVVGSVVSQEYGRLFSMRVRDQNSIVVSLPATLLPGAELTLTVNYAGRLEPQQLDAETLALSQADAAEPFDRPEPSFLYSSQVHWYPRPSSNHHATATLRITVPAEMTCVASGERDPASPVPVIAKEPPARRRTYVFNAFQPLRYFAFVMSRMETVRTVTLDFPSTTMSLSVEANPGHVSRGRELVDRASDITRFYQAILDDIPYPNFTVALIESDLPGGHSPGYFAVLNEPPARLRSLLPRNDPASFENYPDYFLAHEVAHQWWGQAVGWRNYHDQWLSEGFSQYFAALYAQRQRGDAVFRGVVRRMQRWAISETDQGPISLGYRLGHIQNDSRILRALVYNKSALVLHMLRQLLGDEAFFRGLRRFYHESRFRSVGTAEFRAAMETESGRPLGRFFDRWIYGSTLPRLKFSYRVDGGDVVLRIEQRGDVFDVPVTVTLQYADRTSADVLVPVTDRIVDLRVPLMGALRTADISRDDPPLAEMFKD